MGTALVARTLGLALAAAAVLTFQAAAQGSDQEAVPAPDQAAAHGPDLAALQQRVGRLEGVAAVAAGRTAYEAECAPCHGIKGDGRGTSARRFAQRPTDFTQGVYKLQSTLSDSPGNDLPVDADLERSVRQGMSSTEMPPFQGVLSPASIRSVVQYIKTFSPRFSDPQVPRPETAVAKLPESRPSAPSEESAAAGKAVYQSKACADCHGETGEGNADEKDKWGFPVRLVSFRTGMFKSGPSDLDLFRSITTGMRGTTMDPYGGTVSEEETWQLVDYVRSLEDKPSVLFKWMRFLLADRPSGLDYRDRFPAAR
jgi:mono/diheme cytochrome c family protein